MSKEKIKFKKRFKVILGHLPKYKHYLIFGFFAVIGANVLMLINPYLLKNAFDKLQHKAPMSDILTIAILIVVFAVSSGVFRFAMRRSIIWMSRYMEYDLRNELFAHLQKLNPTFYQNNKTGDTMARATNDIEAVRMMIGPGMMHIGNAIASTLIAISFMLYLSPQLTLYSLIPLPIMSIVANKLVMMIHKRFMKIQEYFGVLTSEVQENIAGVRVVRAYNQEDSEIEDFSRHSENYINLNMRLIKIDAFFFPILFMLGGSVNLMVLYFGGRDVISGGISLGTLVAFFAYLTLLIWPMIAMGWVVSLYQRGTASLDRINRILNSKPEVASPPDAIKTDDIKGKIEFKNLDFGYNGKKILHDINLTIEPGQTIGIVGPTASGKSTLISLIGRLFPVPEGKLFIDDIDINKWDIHTLRTKIGFVPQEPFLFSDTIQNNIMFGTDEKNHNTAQKAATVAVIDSEVDEFPEHYNTILGERGITLSGGQKQRLTLARAIAINPRILILDDATSSVDTETEHQINYRLQSEINKRTSLIISHRASAVKTANLIIYMENGTITESGSHEELMSLNGAYARMYKTQLIEEELKRM
jgi:ATP-binding cassette, subfamily B, multidrug efflux pump